mgnify:CR=1 FL=1
MGVSVSFIQRNNTAQHPNAAATAAQPNLLAKAVERLAVKAFARQELLDLAFCELHKLVVQLCVAVYVRVGATNTSTTR